jgi:hypothetical protein
MAVLGAEGDGFGSPGGVLAAQRPARDGLRQVRVAGKGDAGGSRGSALAGVLALSPLPGLMLEVFRINAIMNKYLLIIVINRRFCAS